MAYLFHSRSEHCPHPYFQFFNEFAERNIQSKGKKEKKRKLKERLKKRRADEEQTGKRVRPEVQPEVKPEDNLPAYTSPELQWVRLIFSQNMPPRNVFQYPGLRLLLCRLTYAMSA